MCNTRERVSNAVQRELTSQFSKQVGTHCEEADVYQVDMNLSATWQLEVSSYSQTMNGERQIGNCLATKAAAVHLLQQEMSDIKTGRDKTFYQKLEQHLTKSSETDAFFPTRASLGKSDNLYSYVTTCTSCRSDGKVECTSCRGKGETTCGTCSGRSKVRCHNLECNNGTIHGNDGSFSSCPRCLNGEVSCPNCQGGTVQCVGCHGHGEQTCHSCGGQGYHTHVLGCAVECDARANILHQVPSGAEWVGEYIQEADKFPDLRYRLQRHVVLNGDQHRELVDGGFRVTATGTLTAVEAQVMLEPSSHGGHTCCFIGESLLPYRMDGIGNQLATAMNNELVQSRQDAGELGKILGTGMMKRVVALQANQNLADRTSIEAMPIITGQVGENEMRSLIDNYRDLTHSLKKEGRKIDVGYLVRSTLIHAAVIFFILAFIHFMFAGHVIWADGGITNLPVTMEAMGKLNRMFRYKFQSANYLTTAGLVSAAVYGIIVWRYLPKRRIPVWFHIAGVGVGMLVYYYGIPFMTYGAFGPEAFTSNPPLTLDLDLMVRAVIDSLYKFGEVFAISLLFGFMRAYRKASDTLLSFLDDVGSDLLMKDVGYKRASSMGDV